MRFKFFENKNNIVHNKICQNFMLIFKNIFVVNIKGIKQSNKHVKSK